MTAAEEMRYVLLNPGDVIQKGDEFWSVCRDWEPVDHSIGMSAILPWLPIRRATTLPTERDEAVALLWRWYSSFKSDARDAFAFETYTFLTKIEGK